MNDSFADELGPIDWAIVEFPGGKVDLAGALALELASLVDAELLRVLDLVVIDRATDGHGEVREFEDLEQAGALGDLQGLSGQLANVLTLEDLELVVDVIDDGATAMVLVWENTWAVPFADAAHRSGGDLVGSGRVATETLIDSLEAGARVAGPTEGAPHLSARSRQVGRRGVIGRRVDRSSAGLPTSSALATAIRLRHGGRGASAITNTPGPHDAT